MHYLHPWFVKLSEAPHLFQVVMADLGINFDEEWAEKKSVVQLINQICHTQLAQIEIWQIVYDSRKSLKGKYDALFPKDPMSQRNRSWCYVGEAWYAIAMICARYGYLHCWLCHFNLDEAYELVKAKQIIFKGALVVNGIHVEGEGVIKL